MDLDKKRWIVLGLGCLINLCAGSLYGWSVLSGPMESYLNEVCGAGIAAGGLAVVFTVANMVGPITMIPGGRMNDMLGPRWVIFIGGLLFGGGMLMSGFATSKALAHSNLRTWLRTWNGHGVRLQHRQFG